MTKPTPIVLALAMLTVLAAAPSATADGINNAEIFLDVWDVSGQKYVNVTASFGVNFGGCGVPNVEAQLNGKRAGEAPEQVWTPGAMTSMTPPAHLVSLYWRNTTIASGYDSFSVRVSWASGLTCNVPHATVQTFRAADVYTTNNNQTVINQNGGMPCTGGCVGNSWFNLTFVPNAVFGNVTVGENVTVMSTLNVATPQGPYYQIGLYLAGLAIGVWALPRARGFLQSFLALLIILAALFAVVTSKSQLDAVAAYLTNIITMLYVALAAYAAWHMLREAINPSRTPT